MRIQLKSFNGHTVYDSDYRATLLNPSALPAAKPIFIEESQADAQYSGMFTRDQRNLALQVRILDYANRETLQAQLKAWFKPGTRGNLVATFAADGQDYQLAAIVQSGPVSSGDQLYTIILQAEATAWRAVTADTDTWDLTDAGGTKTIDVEGDDETILSATLTPTEGAPDGYLYQNLYRLVPVDGVLVGMRAWCITINHAALVAAGKSLASGFDLRVWDGDAETRRWISGANTTVCNIWFNADLRRGASLVLRTAVAGTGAVSWLNFTKNATTRAKLKQMPNEGVVYENNEWFYYNRRDVNNCRLAIETRGLYETTEEAHHVGDTFKFLPAPIRTVYGKATATDPELDDDDYVDTKPLFNLASSDNTQWVWTASDLFFDPDHPHRPGTWARNIVAAGDESDVYWIKRNAESGNAAMGGVIGSYFKDGAWRPANAQITWTFHDALGLQTITVTGEKYRNTARWPASKAAIQRRSDSIGWTLVFNEATPASASTWTALTNNSSAKTLAAGTDRVRMLFAKTFAALADAVANFEVQTCTLAFRTANIPAGTLLGEQTNYHLDITLANNTNGDSMDLVLPMRMNRPLILDGEAFTAKYHGTSAHKAIDLDDEGRTIWIRLAPGSNVLAVSGPDVGALTIDLSWYRRRL
jgi:hypothetical protein